jgi:hypothetical protein
MIPIQTDTKGQRYIEWAPPEAPTAYKRAWIRRPERGSDKDWAGTERYLNVVRIDPSRPGSGGNSTDFPIYSTFSDEQILEAFVATVCAITGCTLP